MSDADRLRIIGVLARREATAASSLQLGMSPAMPSITWPSSSRSAVRKTEERYEIDSAGLETLSRKQFARTPRRNTCRAGWIEKARRTLIAYINPDGTIKQILAGDQAPRRPGISGQRLYARCELHGEGSQHHPAPLHSIPPLRGLVDARLLSRESDGSRY
jgi:hypothetical protein